MDFIVFVVAVIAVKLVIIGGDLIFIGFTVVVVGEFFFVLLSLLLLIPADNADVIVAVTAADTDADADANDDDDTDENDEGNGVIFDKSIFMTGVVSNGVVIVTVLLLLFNADADDVDVGKYDAVDDDNSLSCKAKLL